MIGGLYLTTGIFGGFIGFGLSLLIRLENSVQGFVISACMHYTSNYSFHGLFMIFFMIMPTMIGGFGNVILPVMLCISDLMYPRLNALSY
jgi:heme/copper-type cytochrome/quinol oxidase subunit 1